MSIKNTLTIALAGTAVGASMGGKKGFDFGMKIGLAAGITAGVVGTTIFVLVKDKFKEKGQLDAEESLN